MVSRVIYIYSDESRFIILVQFLVTASPDTVSSECTSRGARLSHRTPEFPNLRQRRGRERPSASIIHFLSQKLPRISRTVSTSLYESSCGSTYRSSVRTTDYKLRRRTVSAPCEFSREHSEILSD